MSTCEKINLITKMLFCVIVIMFSKYFAMPLSRPAITKITLSEQIHVELWPLFEHEPLNWCTVKIFTELQCIYHAIFYVCFASNFKSASQIKNMFTLQLLEVKLQAVFMYVCM